MDFLQNLDFFTSNKEALSESTKEMVFQLCQTLTGKNPSELSKEEFNMAISLDMSGLPNSLATSSTSSRQIKQYTPNTYFVNASINLDFSKEYVIKTALAQPTPEDRLNMYFSLRSMYMRYLELKYSSVESLQRDLLRRSEELDGVPPEGRFRK